MQKTEYQIISKKDSKKLTQFLCKEGQLLLEAALNEEKTVAMRVKVA